MVSFSKLQWKEGHNQNISICTPVFLSSNCDTTLGTKSFFPLGWKFGLLQVFQDFEIPPSDSDLDSFQNSQLFETLSESSDDVSASLSCWKTHEVEMQLSDSCSLEGFGGRHTSFLCSHSWGFQCQKLQRNSKICPCFFFFSWKASFLFCRRYHDGFFLTERFPRIVLLLNSTLAYHVLVAAVMFFLFSQMVTVRVSWHCWTLCLQIRWNLFGSSSGFFIHQNFFQFFSSFHVQQVM